MPDVRAGIRLVCFLDAVHLAVRLLLDPAGERGRMADAALKKIEAALVEAGSLLPVLNQGPSGVVAGEAREHRLASMRESKECQDRDRQEDRDDDWRQSRRGVLQHQNRIETDRAVSPDDHHDEKRSAKSGAYRQ